MSRFTSLIRRLACGLDVSYLPRPELLHRAASSRAFGGDRSLASFSNGRRQYSLPGTARLSLGKRLRHIDGPPRFRQGVRTFYDGGGIGGMDFGGPDFGGTYSGSEYSNGGGYPSSSGNDAQQETAPGSQPAQEPSPLTATEAEPPADQVGEDANDGTGLGSKRMLPMAGTYGGGACRTCYGTAGGSRSSDAARMHGGRGSEDSGQGREEASYLELAVFAVLAGVPVFAMGYAWGRCKGGGDGRK